jgi:hypothetical protein
LVECAVCRVSAAFDGGNLNIATIALGVSLMVERAREQRRRRRVPTRRAASIKSSDDPKATRCVLWDLSEDGARLAAPYANKLPPVFTLVDAAETSRVCRIVWRKGSLVGVRFVAGSEREELARARSAKAPREQPAGPLPGNIRALIGARALHDAVERKDLPLSFFALGFLLVLIALTVAFYFAGQESGSGSVWAADICSQANIMCQHPEFPGGASVLMAVVYFTVRGMES